MKRSYLKDIDLGEQDGIKNVCVTARTLIDVLARPDVRPWMTVADVADFLGKSEANLYKLIYSGAIPYRPFKKRESDRHGITLVPVLEALGYVWSENIRELYQSELMIRERLRQEGVDDATISRWVEAWHKFVGKRIEGGVVSEKTIAR